MLPNKTDQEKKKDHDFMANSFRYRTLPLFLLWTASLLAPFAVADALARAPEMMPDFTLASAVDDSVIDSHHHAGKVLLINFWATWCGPCREEIPSLNKLQQEFAKDGFEVIGIALDEGGRALVGRFAKKIKITYPVAMGTPKVARAFGGIIGIPQSFLIDRSGRIVKNYTGLTDYGVLAKDIEALIGR